MLAETSCGSKVAALLMSRHWGSREVADRSVGETQEWPGKTFSSTGVWPTGKGFGDNEGMPTDWQNLSIGSAESVILAVSGESEEVTFRQESTENAGSGSRRTSDFRHLGLWPSECDSTCELVIQPKSLKTETRTI